MRSWTQPWAKPTVSSITESVVQREDGHEAHPHNLSIVSGLRAPTREWPSETLALDAKQKKVQISISNFYPQRRSPKLAADTT